MRMKQLIQAAVDGWQMYMYVYTMYIIRTSDRLTDYNS